MAPTAVPASRQPNSGVVPIETMASMPGLDFVRAIFARQLPEPPITQMVEPFDRMVQLVSP